MPIASVHEDILSAARTRLANLDLDGIEDRIEEREALDTGWMAALPVCPLFVLSGVGIRSDLGTPSNCTDDDAFPLVIRLVDRTQTWSTEKRNTHYKWMDIIIKAFRRKPLTLTFGNAHCTDVLLLPALTIEEEPLAYELISRPMPFEVRTRRPRS